MKKENSVNDKVKNRSRLIVILVLVLAIVASTIIAVYYYKLNNIQILANVTDFDGKLIDQEVSLKVNKNSDGTYSLELPETVNSFVVDSFYKDDKKIFENTHIEPIILEYNKEILENISNKNNENEGENLENKIDENNIEQIDEEKIQEQINLSNRVITLTKEEVEKGEIFLQAEYDKKEGDLLNSYDENLASSDITNIKEKLIELGNQNAEDNSTTNNQNVFTTKYTLYNKKFVYDNEIVASGYMLSNEEIKFKSEKLSEEEKDLTSEKNVEKKIQVDLIKIENTQEKNPLLKTNSKIYEEPITLETINKDNNILFYGTANINKDNYIETTKFTLRNSNTDFFISIKDNKNELNIEHNSLEEIKIDDIDSKGGDFGDVSFDPDGSSQLFNGNVTIYGCTDCGFDPDIGIGGYIYYGWSTSASQAPSDYLCTSNIGYDNNNNNCYFVVSPPSGLCGMYYLWAKNHSNTWIRSTNPYYLDTCGVQGTALEYQSGPVNGYYGGIYGNYIATMDGGAPVTVTWQPVIIIRAAVVEYVPGQSGYEVVAAGMWLESCGNATTQVIQGNAGYVNTTTEIMVSWPADFNSYYNSWSQPGMGPNGGNLQGGVWAAGAGIMVSAVDAIGNISGWSGASQGWEWYYGLLGQPNAYVSYGASNTARLIWVADFSNGYTNLQNMKVDTTRPTISAVSKSTTAWTSGNVTLTVTASDTESGIASTNGYSFDDGTTWQTGNTKAFSANTSNIRVRVKDGVGNISDATTVNIDNIDKTKPTINSVTKSTSDWTSGNITLTVTASDTGGSGIASTNGYSFDNGSTWQTGNTKEYSTNTSNIQVKVKDAVGNISDATTVNITNIDKSGPTVSFSYVTTRTSYLKEQRVTVTLNDVGSQFNFTNRPCYYKWGSAPTSTSNDGTLTATSTTITKNTGTGTFKLYVLAYDALGNSGSGTSEDVNFDNTVPTVSFSPNGGDYAQTHSTTITASDNITAGTSIDLWYIWTTSENQPNGADSHTGYIQTGTLTATSENRKLAITSESGYNGTYYVWVYAKDSAGNIKHERSSAFKFSNTPPAVSFSPNGSTTYAKSHSTTVSVTTSGRNT